MIAISITNAYCLVIQICIYKLSPTQFDTMIRPRWSFWLNIHSRHISCEESSLRRAVCMETYVVQAPRLACIKDLQPRIEIRRRIASIGEIAVFNCSTQLYFLTINIEHFPSDFNLTHAEICSKLTHLFTLIQFCRQTVHLRIILIPQKHPVAHIKGYFLHVSLLDLNRLLSNDNMTCISIK